MVTNKKDRVCNRRRDDLSGRGKGTGNAMMNRTPFETASDSDTSTNLGGRFRRVSISLMLLTTLALPAAAQQAAQTDDGRAHFELMPYLVFGGMGGDLTVKGHESSFSQSAGDVLGNLQFGFMGRARVVYKKWFVGLDGTYMGLGAANVAADAGVDQVIIEPSFGYKAMPRLEVLGGARYNSLQADLNFKGPLAVQVHGEKAWWDPFVGGRLILPLGEKSSISARIDLGGFGAGSKIAVNAEPLFNRKIGKRGTLNAGWKFYYVDYKDNSAGFRYAALSQGPMIGMTLRW